MIYQDTLRHAGRKGGSTPKHKWQDWERDYVRQFYTQSDESTQRIAVMLGVTNCAVKGQVQKLGLCKKSGRKSWDDSQDDQLRDLINKYSPHTVAVRMNRSLNSVVVRSKRLGISRRSRDGWYTKKEVSEILGVDHKRVQYFIDSGQLKASPHGEIHPQKNGGACWHIEQNDLKQFIRKYCQEFNGRQVDLIQVVEILAGIVSV